MRNSNERGIAMISVMLVLILMSALLVGFTTVVMSDQRYRFIDRDRGQSFYAASGAVEKMTGDLGNLFLKNVAPTQAQVTALTDTTNQPVIENIKWEAVNNPSPLPASQLTTYHCKGTTTPLVNKSAKTVGAKGYTITYCQDNASGNPTVSDDQLPIKWGPYEGLIALQTPYQLDVTAHSMAGGGEVHLIRTIEAVAIPVFQFGIFSDADLEFFAGANFNFGGRVHTNGNLFLAQANSSTLTINNKVTAVKQVVRQRMSNTIPIANVLMNGTVTLPTSSTGSRNMAVTEGSVVAGPTSAPTVGPPSWSTISKTLYNSWVRNSATGAKRLDLPLIAVGGANPDLIKRPLHGEDKNSILYAERLFGKASLRVLLSDKPEDFQNLPTVTANAPIMLEGDWNTAFVAGVGGYPPAVGAFSAGPASITHPPVALSQGNIQTTVSGGASTIAQVNVVSTTAFRPAISLGGVAITCTGKAASSFSGCTAVAGGNIPGAIVGATISGPPGISTTVGAVVVAGPGPMTITTALNGTTNFVPKPFYISNVLSNCTGWQAGPPQAFTGCTGLAAGPPSNAVVTNNVVSNANVGLVGGYIKIEVANAAGDWTDVTTEILSFGFGATNAAGAQCGVASADPYARINPDAIVRLQRLRDNTTAACGYANDTTGAKDPTNWWPNALFDSREALVRDADPGTGPVNIPLGGVMYYVTLDVKNLAKWFRRAAPYNTGSGNIARTDNAGYTVYFSDRRNNRNATNEETGEYGYEDVVNTGAAGAANNTLETGEDFNGNNQLDVYGATPNYNGTAGASVPGALAPLTTAARPTTLVSRNIPRINRPILFRRALKLVRGDSINSAGPAGTVLATERITGLTVVSENPVYVEGNWNSYDAASFVVNSAHAATAIIADAITVLSTSWNDISSFNTPYINPPGAGRLRANQSYYRFAALSGKGIAFPEPVGANTVFGTDGGAHNFLRMLEGDNGVQTTVNYRGSMASFFYSRQAVGSFKCCSGQLLDGVVYSVPNRQFFFDTDFLTPSLLPPNTPVFRDMNAVGFSQQLKPGK